MIKAWMLLVTFMAMLFVKSYHTHPLADNAFKTAADHHGEWKAHCLICDILLHKFGEAKTFHFVPVRLYVITDQPQTFISQVVYRPVATVKAHAPPIAMFL
ncbi:MAG: hypothetical protein SPF56_06440 [Bacteroidaceae bacterium]|nr:hypothetical protein [Bacteroidaceae bacterium]